MAESQQDVNELNRLEIPIPSIGLTESQFPLDLDAMKSESGLFKS